VQVHRVGLAAHTVHGVETEAVAADTEWTMTFADTCLPAPVHWATSLFDLTFTEPIRRVKAQFALST